MPKFQDLTSADTAVIRNDLKMKVTQGDFMMIPMYIGSKSNEELQKWVDKINPNLLPDDYEPSLNKSFLRVVFAEQSFNPFAGLFSK